MCIEVKLASQYRYYKNIHFWAYRLTNMLAANSHRLKSLCNIGYLHIAS